VTVSCLEVGLSDIILHTSWKEIGCGGKRRRVERLLGNRPTSCGRGRYWRGSLSWSFFIRPGWRGGGKDLECKLRPLKESRKNQGISSSGESFGVGEFE